MKDRTKTKAYLKEQRIFLLMDKLSHKVPLTRVERLELHGYNPKHLFGKWYLIRHISRNHARFSFYTLYKIDSTY